MGGLHISGSPFPLPVRGGQRVAVILEHCPGPIFRALRAVPGEPGRAITFLRSLGVPHHLECLGSWGLGRLSLWFASVASATMAEVSDPAPLTAPAG